MQYTIQDKETMYKNLLSWLTVLLVPPSCSGTSPAISVVCKENNVGNRIIRWETAPISKEQVKIYTSTSSEAIPEDSKYAYKLSVNSQETTTTVHSAKEDFPNAAKELIEAEYGSVQTYLKKGIGLSAEEIELLRGILLE